MKKAKALSTVLQDALITISDEDSRESRELLFAAGINCDAVVNSSLKKIEQLQRAAEHRLADNRSEADLFKSVKAKIKVLVSRSPERANSFLNSYFQEHAASLRFASSAGFEKMKFDQLKDKINLDDLSNKLDDEAQS